MTHSNQVWAMDITYVRMHKGWLYLCAVVDWYSRKVLAWRLSNTMDVQFCVDAVQEAISRWGTPTIFNTDQGSQFTSDVFTGLLKRHGICISMDGKGAWRDNVFVERLWRSIKYEEIYLKAYDCVRAARSGIAQYLQFYNSNRPHQAHSQATPDETNFAALPCCTNASCMSRGPRLATGLSCSNERNHLSWVSMQKPSYMPLPLP